MTMHTYSLRTWDGDLQQYTPQAGLPFPWEGITLWQLKVALQHLRTMGYRCHRFRDPDGDHSNNDYAVLVERDDEMTDGTR
jgi:hypothetical protein